jgi:YidC/Oxa1 family membrane protein insertase
MDIFTVLIYQPIYNLLVALYRLFGNDLGLAIIAVAVLLRILMLPLTSKQIKMAEKSREFNEQIKELKDKYKNDKEKLNAEMIKLQSQYLPGQLNGCLSLIVQLILIINIYNVVSNLFSDKGIETFNSLAYNFVHPFEPGASINGNFLGIVDLQTVGNTLSDDFTRFLPYLALALMAGAAQYYSSKFLMGLRNKRMVKPEKSSQAKKETKNKKNSKHETPEPADFTAIMERSNRQTMVVFSALLVFMSLTLPAGLSLYWTVQSGLVIIQQLALERIQLWNQKKLAN